MAEYERTLTSQQLAEATIKQCFYTFNSQIFLNYSKVLGVYETLHLVLATPTSTIPSQPYRHLTPQDVEAIYYSYQAIASDEYHTHVEASGTLKAVPLNKDIPQWIFDIVAEITNLTRRE